MTQLLVPLFMLLIMVFLFSSIIYDIEWLTNDDGSLVPEEASMHASETTLDLAMSDWSYEERGIAGPSSP